jgi:hypothetical protein
MNHGFTPPEPSRLLATVYTQVFLKVIVGLSD